VIALSPGLSWLVVGGWLLAVVLIVAFFMGATRGNDRADRMAVDFLISTVAPIDRFRPELDASSLTSVVPEDAHIRIFGGPYDCVDRGDFE